MHSVTSVRSIPSFIQGRRIHHTAKTKALYMERVDAWMHNLAMQHAGALATLLFHPRAERSSTKIAMRFCQNPQELRPK
jgi:hypothetical protein